MVESVCEMEENIPKVECNKTCEIVSGRESTSKEGIIGEKIQILIEENTYLTEE
jgi:hypothetical protein